MLVVFGCILNFTQLNTFIIKILFITFLCMLKLQLIIRIKLRKKFLNDAKRCRICMRIDFLLLLCLNKVLFRSYIISLCECTHFNFHYPWIGKIILFLITKKVRQELIQLLSSFLLLRGNWVPF